MSGSYSFAYPERTRSTQAGLLEQVSALRTDAGTLMRQGDYEAAIQRDTQALDLVQSAIGPLETAGTERIPEIQQAAVLFGEIALAQSLLGNLDQTSQHLEQAILHFDRATRLVPLMTGLDTCDHDRKTYKPDGDCQYRPPCPPRRD